MKWRWVIYVLWAGLLIGPWEVSAERQRFSILRSDEEEILLDVQTTNYTIGPSSVEGFHEIRIPDCAYTADPGRPMLPMKGILLGVPSDANIEVEVVSSEMETRSGLRVVPCPRVVMEGRGEAGEPGAMREIVEPDPDAYNRDVFEPQGVAEITWSGFLRHQRVVRLGIWPVQYNPAEGAVRIYTHLRVRVRFASVHGQGVRGKAAYERPSATDDRLFEGLYERLLLNYSLAWAVAPSPWQTRSGWV